MFRAYQKPLIAHPLRNIHKQFHAIGCLLVIALHIGMKSRSVVMKVPRNKARSQKPPCSQGMRCPYRNEYQHQMEFSHDAMPSSSVGAGRGKSSGSPFAGGGHRLGAGTGSSSSGSNVYRGRDHAQDEWLRSLEFESFGNGGGNGFVPDSLEDKFCCELCNDIISLSAFDAHLQQHTRQQREQESSNLRKEQDREYEQSVRLEQEKERQRELAEKEAERIERLKQAGEKRRRQREQDLEDEMKRKLFIRIILPLVLIVDYCVEQRQTAKENLRPEPDSTSYYGKALTLRFILPSGMRLTRRFRVETVMQDVRDYLLTIDELFGKGFILRSPGQEDIHISNSNSDFLIKENTTFAVMIAQQEAVADASLTSAVAAGVDVIDVQEGGSSDSPVAKRQKRHEKPQQAVSSRSGSSNSNHVFVDLT